MEALFDFDEINKKIKLLNQNKLFKVDEKDKKSTLEKKPSVDDEDSIIEDIVKRVDFNKSSKKDEETPDSNKKQNNIKNQTFLF